MMHTQLLHSTQVAQDHISAFINSYNFLASPGFGFTTSSGIRDVVLVCHTKTCVQFDASGFNSTLSVIIMDIKFDSSFPMRVVCRNLGLLSRITWREIHFRGIYIS